VFSESLELGLGEDTGKAIGTIAQHAGPGVTLSLGFPNAAQTRGVLSFRHIEFSARRANAAVEFEDLGRPSESAWLPSLRNVGAELVDASSGTVHEKAGWLPYSCRTPVPSAPLCTGTRVGDFDLLFQHGVEEVFYGSHPVLAYPGSIRTGLYYDGRIAVAHVDSDTSRAWISVADWLPSWERAENVKRYHWVHAADIYAMIGWRGAIYFTDGADATPERTMRLYRITRSGIEIAAEHKHTYRGGNEGYGMAVCGDQLLIGHYPSGLVLAYDGEALKPVSFGHEINHLLGVGLNPYAYGEAQTIAVYAGAVWVGHYPWGYLLEGSADLSAWRAHALFRGPAPQPNSCPYRNQVSARLAALQASTGQSAESHHFYDEMWARRIHSAAYSGNGMALGLGSRRGTVFDAARDEGIDPAELADYGVVRVARAPNVVVAPFPWPSGGRARICAHLTPTEMILSVNDTVVGRARHDLSTKEILAFRTPQTGRGVYGESEVEIARVVHAGALPPPPQPASSDRR
jgi:hypothetical protein